MKLVVFGLSVSSSWGNGHATLWRALIRALGAAGHRVTFFERDAPWSARHRDLVTLPGPARLVLYDAWQDVVGVARRELAGCDCAMVTSSCPDAEAASRAVLGSTAACRVYYDLDTAVTLTRLATGEDVESLPAGGLEPFDLVLSSVGGRALVELQLRLGARRVAALYGSVDDALHAPAQPRLELCADLSFLGTHAGDRAAAFRELLLEPARRRPGARFLVAGPKYPSDERAGWPANVAHLEHVAPSEHPTFYASAALSLSLTRGAFARYGWCPSGRLFEAAACGAPIISDAWAGLDDFFTPGEEILVARRADDVLEALDLGEDELIRLGRAARARALVEHTARARAAELVRLVEQRGHVASAGATS
jgi:spore maturation protein CgeB